MFEGWKPPYGPIQSPDDKAFIENPQSTILPKTELHQVELQVNMGFQLQTGYWQSSFCYYNLWA